MLNVEQTIQPEFANSPSTNQLIANMNSYLDPQANILAFYNAIWNVATAVGFGLDIWGRIVGVGRVIPIPGTENTFGFDNSDVPPDWENFGVVVGSTAVGGPFFAGQINTGGFSLNDTAYRTLILTKALANISATTAPALNQLIQNLFPGRGRAYVLDLGNMAMRYVFEFSLSSIEYAILANSGVLPHPAGVSVSILVINGNNFGFKEADGGGLVLPFNYGTFFNGSAG
jgi:hypothetical protein